MIERYTKVGQSANHVWLPTTHFNTFSKTCNGGSLFCLFNEFWNERTVYYIHILCASYTVCLLLKYRQN